MKKCVQCDFLSYLVSSMINLFICTIVLWMVCQSVCPSVTNPFHIETNEHRIM